VLLVAVSQGQLVLGIGMVVAFGAGMAIVLGGLGLVVVLARRRFDRGRLGLAAHPLAARIGRAIPAASALAVLAIGIVLALEAVGRIG
jgi:ABC-type nickel/cobalt efflux system permease component RcnA